jgi:hypothetical protein
LSEIHLLGQAIQGRAQLHFVSAGAQLRKTSTPTELEILQPAMSARGVQKIVSFCLFWFIPHF